MASKCLWMRLIFFSIFSTFLLFQRPLYLSMYLFFCERKRVLWIDRPQAPYQNRHLQKKNFFFEYTPLGWTPNIGDLTNATNLDVFVMSMCSTVAKDAMNFVTTIRKLHSTILLLKFCIVMHIKEKQAINFWRSPNLCDTKLIKSFLNWEKVFFLKKPSLLNFCSFAFCLVHICCS